LSTDKVFSWLKAEHAERSLVIGAYCRCIFKDAASIYLIALGKRYDRNTDSGLAAGKGDSATHCPAGIDYDLDVGDVFSGHERKYS
jgi:hypothetical protein